MPDDTIFFDVQAEQAGGAEWSALAQRLEEGGFDGLYVSDHPGLTASPFVSLAAAAAATTTLKLGTAVVNAGVRRPFDVAGDAATLAMLAGPRVVLGMGAGHTPAEWSAIGQERPSAGERRGRLDVFVDLVQRLLAGERVDHEGPHFTLRDAALGFRPGPAVEFMVGGNGLRVLQIGAAKADIVNFGGMGATLPDGHQHEVRWSAEQISQSVEAIRHTAGERRVQISALVQMVVPTDDSDQAAHRLLDHLAERQPVETLPTAEDILRCPFVFFGTEAEIADQFVAARDRWGIDRFLIRADAADTVQAVMTRL